MNSQITEFSFGFALTREIVNLNPAGFLAAPVFPSLIQEGNPGGGYDVALDFGTFLFLQFKLSEYMIRNTAGQSDVIAPPYYRFWLMPASQSAQHAMLLDLEGSGEQVYYVAPKFWTQAQFNGAFTDSQVAFESVFIPPGAIGPVTDNEDHCVVFNDVAIFALSEPKPIQGLRGEQALERISNSLSGAESKVRATREVASTMEGIVRRHNISPPDLKSFHGTRQVLEYIASLAYVFFHSEMIFIPHNSVGAGGPGN